MEIMMMIIEKWTLDWLLDKVCLSRGFFFLVHACILEVSLDEEKYIKKKQTDSFFSLN
jgi:hypothetical protein